MLAYFEQFYAILNQDFQQNIDDIISYYIEVVNITSFVLGFALLLIIKAINYRWQEMKNEAKYVQSILRLVSLKHIQ